MSDLNNVKRCLIVIKQTIDEWREDETGRVYVHKDVISKATSAALYSVGIDSVWCPTCGSNMKQVRNLVDNCPDSFHNMNEKCPYNPLGKCVNSGTTAQPSASEGERVEQAFNQLARMLESKAFPMTPHDTAEPCVTLVDLQEACKVIVARLFPTKGGEHDYLSTACFHGKHESCRKECKFCCSSCRCSCHATKGGAR